MPYGVSGSWAAQAGKGKGKGKSDNHFVNAAMERHEVPPRPPAGRPEPLPEPAEFQSLRRDPPEHQMLDAEAMETLQRVLDDHVSQSKGKGKDDDVTMDGASAPRGPPKMPMHILLKEAYEELMAERARQGHRLDEGTGMKEGKGAGKDEGTGMTEGHGTGKGEGEGPMCSTGNGGDPADWEEDDRN